SRMAFCSSTRNLVALALVLLVAAACSGGSTPSAATGSAPTSAPAAPATSVAPLASPAAAPPVPSSVAVAASSAAAPVVAAGSQSRTIVDMAGRSVTVPAQINRFATGYPAVNQMVFMLGAADKLVATSQDAANQALFVTLYPRLKDVPAAFDSGL